MRDREKDMRRESEEGKQREKVRERNGNEETKSIDLEQARSKDGFLADTSNCTGSITTKLLIIYDYTRHLLSTLRGSVCYTSTK